MKEKDPYLFPGLLLRSHPSARGSQRGDGVNAAMTFRSEGEPSAVSGSSSPSLSPTGIAPGWHANWSSCVDESAPSLLEDGWLREREPQLSWAWQWLQTALRVVPAGLRRQCGLLFASVALAISEGEGLPRAWAWWEELKEVSAAGRRLELAPGGFML